MPSIIYDLVPIEQCPTSIDARLAIEEILLVVLGWRCTEPGVRQQAVLPLRVLLNTDVQLEPIEYAAKKLSTAKRVPFLHAPLQVICTAYARVLGGTEFIQPFLKVVDDEMSRRFGLVDTDEGWRFRPKSRQRGPGSQWQPCQEDLAQIRRAVGVGLAEFVQKKRKRIANVSSEALRYSEAEFELLRVLSDELLSSTI